MTCELETGICRGLTGQFIKNITAMPKQYTKRIEISDFVREKVSQLSLREKIGQMTQLQINVLMNEDDWERGILSINYTALRQGIKDYGVGSYFDSPYSSAPSPVTNKSGWTVYEAAQFMTELKSLALEWSNSSLPIIFGIDSVHGANYIYNATLFPQNIGVAATFDPELAAQGPGRIASRDTRLAGISWQFSPVLGIGINPLWPRIYETFGEDPYLVSQFAKAILPQIELNLNSQTSCASCLKHFAGYPNPRSGKDRTDAWYGQRQIKRYFLPPFEEAFQTGAATVMINSGSINGVPVHSSPEYLTHYLRDVYSFDGVAVSDYEDIDKLVFYHHLVNNSVDATLLAINAGLDMSMVPLDYSFCHIMYYLVESGQIPESRIDESVSRILQLKENLGLFGDNYLPDLNNPAMGLVGGEQDWEIAYKLASESLTLIRNAHNILPLPRTGISQILVTGPAGNSISALSGGWSIHWQGAADWEFPYGITIFQGIQNFLSNTTTKVVFNQGVDFTQEIDIDSVVSDAKNSDYIILCIGEAPEAETPGDIDDLTLSEPQLKLFQALKPLLKPIIVILVEARPRVLNEINNNDVIVNSYLPGPIGGRAIADLLFGVFSPSGRSPITYPRFSGDVGVNYFHEWSSTNDPLVRFGGGLQYTTFHYSDCFISQNIWNITAVPELNFRVTITNTGNYYSDHVALLYISDVYCTVAPEVKMLRRFQRFSNIAPRGGFVTFEGSLNADDVSFIDRNLQRSIESGDFFIFFEGTQESAHFTLVM